MIFIKDINSTAEITAVFSDPTTGANAVPDTSIVIDIYPANSDTQTITSQAMSVKDSVTGYYKYAWNISSVDAGHYNYIITAVNDSVTYSAKGEVEIFDTSADALDSKIDTIDTNVDAILVDTGSSIPASISTVIGKIGTPADTSVSKDISNMQADVDSILVDTGTTLPALISSTALRGSGNIAEIVTIKRADGTPIAGVVVWLTTDSAGSNAFTDKNQTTNSGGRITFFIEANVTYYVWTDREDGYIDTINRSS